MRIVTRKVKSALSLLRGDDALGQFVRRALENVRGVRLALHGASPLFYEHAIGFPFVVAGGAPETREIYLRAQSLYEVTESKVMSRWLSTGDFAIDCGANVGLITSLMAARVGRQGSVWALEASPSTAEKLSVVVSALGLTQVTIHQVAISDVAGEVFFSDNDLVSQANAIRKSADYEGRSCARAEAISLQDLLARSASTAPALVKLDIEGAEPLAFRGWPALCNLSDPPLLVFEVYPRGLERLNLTPADIFRALPLARYRFWHLNASWPNSWPEYPRGVPFVLEDPLEHRWPMHSNVVAVPSEGAFARRASRLRGLLPACE